MTDVDFTGLIEELEDAKTLRETPAAADEKIDRAIRLLAQAQRLSMRDDTGGGGGGRDRPGTGGPPPRDPSDMHPPAEPELNAPRRRDFKYDGDANEVEALSDMAKGLARKDGKWTGTHCMARAASEFLARYPDSLPVIGVHGGMPERNPMMLAGGYSKWDQRSIKAVYDGVALPASVVFVGDTDDAEICISMGHKNPNDDAHMGTANEIGLWNLGLRGANDSFIMRQLGFCNRILIDGCWWLQHESFDGNGSMHASGMHLGEGYNFLLWRNHQFRGKRPVDPGTLLREHLFYDKAGPGIDGTWILDNDLRGGNRTATQRRPHPSVNGGKAGGSEPEGLYYAARNKANGYGWTHGSTGETYDGGSLLTNWCNPNADVWYIDNEVTDAKYGCLVTSWQPASSGNFTNPEGRTFDRVFLKGNKFENTRGDRACASLSSANEIHILPGNTFEGNGSQDLVLDSSTAAKWGAPRNGQVFIHGAEMLEYLKTRKVAGWLPSAQDLVYLSPEQLDAMLYNATGVPVRS